MRALARSTGLDVHVDASLLLTTGAVSQQALGAAATTTAGSFDVTVYWAEVPA